MSVLHRSMCNPLQVTSNRLLSTWLLRFMSHRLLSMCRVRSSVSESALALAIIIAVGKFWVCLMCEPSAKPAGFCCRILKDLVAASLPFHDKADVHLTKHSYQLRCPGFIHP